MTCLPLPFACNSHIWRSASATHFAEEAARLPLPFACNSIINTHVAFRFRNSLCGGHVTCLPFPFAVMTTHKAFRLQLTLRRRPRDLSALAIYLQSSY